jgi:valyl-tRNA synthetase
MVKMRVIADEYVEQDFGTGVVKITPYHDHYDYEVWQRHKDELPEPQQVIGFDGKMTAVAGRFAGLKVKAAREAVVKAMKEQGLIEKIDENYETQLATCYRCGQALEPLPRPQFFVRVKPLTAPVIEALDKGEVTIHGQGYDKILRNWLVNLRDWNISRQIVWGIRLPVWYEAAANPEIRVTFIVDAAAEPGETENGVASGKNANGKGLLVKELAEGKLMVTGTLGEAMRAYPLPCIKAGLQNLQAPVGAKYAIRTGKLNAENEMLGQVQDGESATLGNDDIVRNGKKLHVVGKCRKTASGVTAKSCTCSKKCIAGGNVNNEWDESKYIQETDTFDTWFSSAQWPFATLANTEAGDLERFYPLSVMETGYDILPFWVMRMLMVGKFATGKIPFGQVYLHGLVRDSKGQKMSKSKGNVVNPLEVVEKYGADALRFALMVRSSAGQDKAVGEADFKAARNLTNKIWNAARFVKTALGGELIADEKALTVDEQATERFNRELGKIGQQVTEALENYKPGLAADLLYDSFWHFFCDVAIEEAKKGLLSPTLLAQGLKTYLQLWQPIVPFVTEAAWGELGEPTLLAGDGWPRATEWDGSSIVDNN